jgi:hypothetical protein
MEIGLCSNTFQRFYYNQTDKKCLPFDYTGCGGNLNNFITENECNIMCLNGTNVEDENDSGNIILNPSENQYVVLVDFDTNSPVNWTLKDVEIISIDEIHHNVIIPSEETMYESDIKELSKLFSVKEETQFEMEFDIKKISTENTTTNIPYFVAKVSCLEGIDLMVHKEFNIFNISEYSSYFNENTEWTKIK